MKNFLSMTNTNTFSDSQCSQETTLMMDEETYKELEQNLGRELESVADHLVFDKEEPIYFEEDTKLLIPATKKLREEKADEDINIPYGVSEILNHYDNNFQNYTYQNIQFQFTLGDGGNNQDFVYSKHLDKLFIKMEKIVPLRFHWEPLRNPVGLYIRTRMIFKVEQYKSEPVRRCHNHMASTYSANQNIDPNKLPHVVHCVNSDTIYEEQNKHLSIVTSISSYEPGAQYVPMCFKFFCKNSCQSGMNRRPTELVFTLEDSEGHVLGQKELEVRICSCPKRDKQKEEKEKNSQNLCRQNSGNKMLSSCDTHIYKVDINVVGKENFLAVLKYAYDAMAGQATRTGQYHIFQPYMDAILQKMP